MNKNKKYTGPTISGIYGRLDETKDLFLVTEEAVSGIVSADGSDNFHATEEILPGIVYITIEFNYTKDEREYTKIIAAKIEVPASFISNFYAIRNVIENCPTFSTGKYNIYREDEFQNLLGESGPYANFSITEIRDLKDLFQVNCEK